jgi:hypothetical protein
MGLCPRCGRRVVRVSRRRDHPPSSTWHDAKVMDRLIRDDDTAVYSDKGYASDA